MGKTIDGPNGIVLEQIAPVPQTVRAEIRRDDRGGLDEVVVHGALIDNFHLERMDEGSWWMRIDLVDGRAIVVNLCAKNPGRTRVEGYVSSD